MSNYIIKLNRKEITYLYDWMKTEAETADQKDYSEHELVHLLSTEQLLKELFEDNKGFETAKLNKSQLGCIEDIVHWRMSVVDMDAFFDDPNFDEEREILPSLFKKVEKVSVLHDIKKTRTDGLSKSMMSESEIKVADQLVRDNLASKGTHEDGSIAYWSQ